MNYEEALAHAEAVVVERGADFVYNPDGAGTCSYVPQSHPLFPSVDGVAEGAEVTGCLVGEILKRADLLDDYVAGATDSITTLVTRNKVNVEGGAHGKTRLFLSSLQTRQDAGQSWGDALKAAKSTAEHSL